MKETEFGKAQIARQMRELGFSEQEARVFLYLYENGARTSVEIAEALGIARTAVYRTCRKLVEKGVVAQISEQPRVFEVLGGLSAIRLMIERERSRKLGALSTIEKSLSRRDIDRTETSVELIDGRTKIYKRSVELINMSKSEAFIVSVGEHLPPDLMLADRNASLRGVDIRFIAHRCDSTNESALQAMKKNGVSVKYYPDWGFHLLLVDRKILLLGINNPENPYERVAMLLFNSALTDAMRQYFLDTWEKAYPV